MGSRSFIRWKRPLKERNGSAATRRLLSAVLPCTTKALSIADRIYLTEVHAEVIGDVSFPADLSSDWIEMSRERHEAGEQDDFDYSFLVLDRVATV